MQAVQGANDRLRQMLRAMVTTKQSRSGLSSPRHSHQHQGQCHRAGGCSPAKGAQVLHGSKAVRAHARKVAAAGQHHCQHHYHCCHPAPCKCKAHRWQSQLDTEAHSVVMSGIVTKHATCKATHGRGYRGILPALFGALTILWSADLHGLLPRWQQKYTIACCAKTLPHGEWACRDASRVVARGRDALHSHLQRQQDARRTPLPALWESLPQPDLASPRAVASSPAASPGRACDPGRSHRTLPMQIW